MNITVETAYFTPMGRVVDLAQLGGMCTGPGGLTVRVSDPLCPWNEGTWRLETVDGRLRVGPDTREDCALSIQDVLTRRQALRRRHEKEERMLHQAYTHTSPPEGGTCFFTLVGTPRQAQHARLLIESLRAFGGRLNDCAVWLLYHDQAGSDLDVAYRDLEGVHLVPLAMEDGVRYWFAAKVQACAQAEGMAGSGVRSLVWVGPECLIVQPPLLFDLAAPAGASSAAAFRTVHHVNVGSPAQEPLDAFWAAVYRLVGLDEAPFSIESFVDVREIRPYWNTHCFSVDPACGLLRAWREGFRDMVADEAFQVGPCRDELHRIFLHQAVLSALIAKRVALDRICALPPEYSYPLHMHAQVPAARRVQALNDLVCAVYEEDLPLDGIRVHEPLRSWLVERATPID